jgi:hypothetical protein
MKRSSAVATRFARDAENFGTALSMASFKRPNGSRNRASALVLARSLHFDKDRFRALPLNVDIAGTILHFPRLGSEDRESVALQRVANARLSNRTFPLAREQARQEVVQITFGLEEREDSFGVVRRWLVRRKLTVGAPPERSMNMRVNGPRPTPTGDGMRSILASCGRSNPARTCTHSTRHDEIGRYADSARQSP